MRDLNNAGLVISACIIAGSISVDKSVTLSIALFVVAAIVWWVFMKNDPVDTATKRRERANQIRKYMERILSEEGEDSETRDRRPQG